MTTFTLIPGAGGAAWYWHRVSSLLQDAGHRAIAVDLPADDESAGLPEYARLVTEATGAAGTAPRPPARRVRHAWPDIPVRVVAGEDDRFFPADFQRRVAADRLGVTASVLPGGHLIALSQPDSLAGYLLSVAADTA